jgi:hypothetical protein
VLALPFVALLLPLFKIGPPLYQWRVRSRIYRWYADVRAIDMRLLADSDRESILRQLHELEHDVAAGRVDDARLARRHASGRSSVGQRRDRVTWSACEAQDEGLASLLGYGGVVSRIGVGAPVESPSC